MSFWRHTCGTCARLLRRLARPVLRHVDAAAQATYAQTEALTALYATLPIRRPLPPLRRSSVSPDFATELVGLVLDLRPGLILELGSGASTLIAAYVLEKIGSGRIVSLEHDSEWHERSTSLVRAHGLTARAEVVHASLRPHVLGGENWPWYDLTQVEGLDSIDLLIVDGPPGTLRDHARYPAVPLLIERLAPTAAIIVDDAARPDEAAIVRRWCAEHGPFRVEQVRTERGLAVLWRETAGRQRRTAQP